MSTPPPEVTIVETRRASCDGAGAIRGTDRVRPAALGHPRVFLEIDETGYVDCGYCDRRFILKHGPADPDNATEVELVKDDKAGVTGASTPS